MADVLMKKYEKKRRYLFEIVLGYLAIDSINFLLFPNDPGFQQAAVNPYWILVLLMAGQYGFGPGVLTGFIATSHALILLFHGIPTRAAIEKAVENQGLLVPLLFTVVGALLGEVRQRHIEADLERREELEKCRESMKRMKEWLDSGDKARQILEARIVGQNTTVRALYDAACKMAAMDLASVYQEALNILASYFQVKKSALYVKEKDYYVLRSAWGWDEQQLVEGKVPVGSSLMDIVFHENRAVTIQDILKQRDSEKYMGHYGEALAMIPIRDEKNAPIGVVNIEKMDFMAFNKPNLDMIELVVEWISQTLRNIKFFDSMRVQLIRDAEYDIFNYSYFEQRLQQEFQRARNFNLPLNVSVIKLSRFGFLSPDAQRLAVKTLVTLMKRAVAETDTVFRYRYDGTFAILSPMKQRADMSNVFHELHQGLKPLSGELVTGSVDFQKEMASPEEMMKSVLKECRLGGF